MENNKNKRKYHNSSSLCHCLEIFKILFQQLIRTILHTDNSKKEEMKMKKQRKQISFAIICILFTIALCIIIASIPFLRTIDTMDGIVLAMAVGFMIKTTLQRYMIQQQKRWEG